MPEWMHVIWRSLLAIAVLFAMTRLLGYRQIGQLNYFQYITGITIGSIAAVASIEFSNWHLAVVALITWALVAFGIEWISMKSKWARDLFEGKGVVLIKDGKILEDNLKKVRYNTDDLMGQLRTKSAFRAADVEFAVLETTGELSVLMRKEKQPLTASALGVDVPNEQEPQTVIEDGEVMDEPLATIGFSRQWLHQALEKQGVTIENVFLGQVDQYGQLYLDLYDDQIQMPKPQERQLLMANLKKSAADLELFALATNDESAKRTYGDCAASINQMITTLTPWLER